MKIFADVPVKMPMGIVVKMVDLVPMAAVPVKMLMVEEKAVILTLLVGSHPKTLHKVFVVTNAASPLWTSPSVDDRGKMIVISLLEDHLALFRQLQIPRTLRMHSAK